MSVNVAELGQREHSLRSSPRPENHKASLEVAAESIIQAVGDSLDRPGLERTPERFAKALTDILSGYRQSPAGVVGQGVFASAGKGLVVVRDLEFFSMCEHHMLPFWGKATVAYFPREKILGLSKIPRLIDVFAKRLQVQERITEQVADAVVDLVDARGVIVSVTGQHMCMMMRGVSKQHSNTATLTHRFSDDLSDLEKQQLMDCVRTS